MQPQDLIFHIESDDYFATLATVLDLLRQDAEFHRMRKRSRMILERTEELLYLQENFKIVRKMDRQRPGRGSAQRCSGSRKKTGRLLAENT